MLGLSYVGTSTVSFLGTFIDIVYIKTLLITFPFLLPLPQSTRFELRYTHKPVMSRVLARQIRRARPIVTDALVKPHAGPRAFSATPRRHQDMESGGSTSHLTEDQIAVREGVAAVCARFPNEYWRERERTQTDPADFHAALAEGGWLGIALPESLGAGLGISEAAIMMQTITESGAGMAGAQAVHANVYATQPLVAFGTEEQLRDTLPGIVAGRLRACFGVTEPDAGLDTLRLKTFAKKLDDGSYSVTGQKIWITCAQVAQKMVLLARTRPLEEVQRPSDALSLFCIDLDRSAPGLDVRKIDKMGGRAVDANEVFFDDYRIPAETMIGSEGDGFRIVMHGMNAERCLLAAESLGLGYAALGRAAQYARDRVVFRRPIGQNQGIAHPLADVYMQLEAAKLATYHAARLFDQSRAGKNSVKKDVGVAANTAKYLAAEAAFKACERAILTHGGMG